MERPDGFAIVDSIPEGVRKRTALGDRRGYRRFQKVHCPGVWIRRLWSGDIVLSDSISLRLTSREING